MFIQDGFCQDRGLLERLAAESAWSALKRLNWWDGWWVTPARNVWEEAIEAIWRRQAGIEKQIAGFEYWANTLAAGDTTYLGWHHDKDEVLYRETGRVVSPSTGTIYYAFPHQVVGGYLEISKDDSLTDIERIEPVFNRLVIFNAAQWHRVSKVYAGTRRAFLANLWQQKPKAFEAADFSV